MKILRYFCAAALAMTLALSAQAKLRELPADPEVRIGTLPNGLTYYLRHNDTPKNQVDFYLAQKVGSVNETEEQRGLAHFLEHMCFNGTKHFPGNTVISYLESLGVKFGANLNAYTSTDQTVYNICRVPAARQSALDSCLLILRDWSHDLRLDGKDIDEERGVIVSEWRQRNGSANNRLLEKAAPEIYGDCIYGHRLPIGLMSVVENFPHKTLREYYKKWYHPVNQAVIVVGDIDVDRTEAEIQKLWGDIKPAEPGTVAQPVIVSANARPIATVQSDPEQQMPMVTLYIKHADVADSLENTIEELRRATVIDLVNTMLVDRLDNLEQRPDAPVANIGIGDMNFLMARTQPALLVRGQAKPGRETEAVSGFAEILKQAAKHGFTETELKRAKIDAMGKLENEYANRASVTNTDYARRYVNLFLEGGASPSAEQYYKMMKGVIGRTTLANVNAYVREIVTPDDANVVLIAYVPSGSKLTKDDLVKAYTGVDRDALAAYVDEDVTGSLMDKLPEPGTIVKEETVDAFGSKVWTLSNGVRVHLRHNAKKADQVLIQGYSEGGMSIGYDPKLGPEYRLMEHALPVCAVGPYTQSRLRKMLAGKTLRHDIKIEEMRESMGVATTPADLETAMQLIYLKATDLRKDTIAYRNMVENRRLKLSSTNTNPTFIMGDSIHSNVFNHHPFGEKLSLADLDSVSYDRIMNIYRDRFGDMSDFTFYITGNFDEDSLRNLATRYLAALPSHGRVEHQQDCGYRYMSGRVHKRFTCPMETPQSICYTFYHYPCDYNVQNLVAGHMLGTLVANSLREDIREKRGWTYGVKSHIGLTGAMNGQNPSRMIMPVYIRVSPENATATFQAVTDGVDAFADAANISAEDIAKVQQNMLKDYADSGDDNAYWISVMYALDRYGEDFRTGYEAAVKAQTPATLSAFARRHLLPASRIQLEMSPE